MKINHRFISLIIVVLLAISLLSACTPTVDKPVDNEVLLQNAGFMVEKTTVDEKNFVEIGNNGSSIKLEVVDKDLFDSVEGDEFYIYTYDGDNILKSISKNETIKGPVLSSMEQGIEPNPNEITDEIPPVDKVPVEDLTILDQYEFDFKGNGDMGSIVTYTNAERNENGDMMWDDGQRWLIVVHSEDKDYVIFDDYVQLGRINSYIYSINGDFYIATLSSGTANLTLKLYIYNPDKDMFMETIQYNKDGNVNMHHTTVGFL